jgi:hypothetical protein
MMIKTRFVGIVGSIGLLILVLAEVSLVDWNQAVDYSPVELGLILTSFSLGLILLIRIFLLVRGKSWSYSLQSVTWALVLTLLILFSVLWVYATSPIPDPPCEPQPDKICFTFHVLYRQSPLAISAFYFLGVSIVRSLSTMIFALLLVKKRLK